MVREIVIFGDPVLRTKCARVENVPDDIGELVTDMLETMVEADGIGLAAPQVGLPIQLAVADVSHAEESVSYLRVNGEVRELGDVMPLVFLNPEIEFGEVRESLEEGCLSIPEIRGNVVRPAHIKLGYDSIEGERVVLETDGLLARVIQHETDHLNGVLFIDRLSAAQKLSLKNPLRELKASHAR